MASAAKNIRAHLDDELMWIVSETHSNVYRDVKSVRRVDLCKTIGAAVGATLIEREGENAEGMEISEFETLASDSISGMSEETLAAGSHVISMHVAEACVVFMECRKLGMRSPYIVKRIFDNYNPFGNEGGFCNPMKLKMMDD